MSRISVAKFRELVAEALDDLPEEWAARLDNVVVVVEEEPSAEDLDGVGLDPNIGSELLGLYQGVPLDERGVYYSALPDRVVIYRKPILRVAGSRGDIVRVIRETVLHELGHHFGLAEDDLPF
jgi:predicted Zn-dependent protease with MMP-like domain